MRFIGTNTGFIHPMHIHGGPFRIVATDGNPVPAKGQWSKDTVNVGPGERYDVIWEAREPGKWLLHCHITHHTTNNNARTRVAAGSCSSSRSWPRVRGGSQSRRRKQHKTCGERPRVLATGSTAVARWSRRVISWPRSADGRLSSR